MVKPKCIGTTKGDKACKNPRKEGSMYCAVHKTSNLNEAPKDVKLSILFEVAPQDLPNFCATNREYANMCRDLKFRTAYKAKWALGDVKTDFFLGRDPKEIEPDTSYETITQYRGFVSVSSLYVHPGRGMIFQMVSGDDVKDKGSVVADVFHDKIVLAYLDGDMFITYHSDDRIEIEKRDDQDISDLVKALKKRGIDIKTATFGSLDRYLTDTADRIIAS
jgi:hypothetical protein